MNEKIKEVMHRTSDDTWFVTYEDSGVCGRFEGEDSCPTAVKKWMEDRNHLYYGFVGACGCVDVFTPHNW